MIKTVGDLWNEQFPPECRYVATFTSIHKTTDGGSVSQNQRRFFLADSAGSTREATLRELNDPFYFDGVNNRWGNLAVAPCPQAAVYVGYFRFQDDIRQTRMNIIPLDT